jgi:hypothetical protein
VLSLISFVIILYIRTEESSAQLEIHILQRTAMEPYKETAADVMYLQSSSELYFKGLIA